MVRRTSANTTPAERTERTEPTATRPAGGVQPRIQAELPELPDSAAHAAHAATGAAPFAGGGSAVTTEARVLDASSPLFAARAARRGRDPVADHAAALRAPPFDAGRFDRAAFFDGVRASPFSRLSQPQVDGMTTILDEWERRGMTDLRCLAYMFATTYHETAQTMQPIEEFGKGRGKRYGRRDPETGKTYYGRGFVQLTWKENYATMGRLLGVDLVRQPELALRADVACSIMFEGMTTSLSLRGDFTGKSLENYFTAEKTDWFNARRIINGTDKAEPIAKLAEMFFADLIAAHRA